MSFRKFFAGLAVAGFLVGLALPAQANGGRANPNWVELKGEQQQILSPLQADWNALEPQRKRKWIGVANRYPSMKPDEQARVRERMRDWAALTPDERRFARDNFQAYRALPSDQKQAVQTKWREYQALPEDKRRELASRPATLAR